MVAVGVAAPGENQATEILHGYVARVGLGHKNSSLFIFSFIFNFFFVWLLIDPCANPSDYASVYGVQLEGAGNDCKTNYKWAFSMQNGKRSHLVSVKVDTAIQILIFYHRFLVSFVVYLRYF